MLLAAQVPADERDPLRPPDDVESTLALLNKRGQPAEVELHLECGEIVRPGPSYAAGMPLELFENWPARADGEKPGTDTQLPTARDTRATREGVTQEVTLVTEDVKEGRSACRFSATSTLAETGGWAAFGRSFDPPISLRDFAAIGLWVKGDGQQAASAACRAPLQPRPAGLQLPGFGNHAILATVPFLAVAPGMEMVRPRKWRVTAMEPAIRAALKSQYRAAFETVRDAIQRCPEDLWEEPGAMPQFWQIAYHAVFFGHFYMLQKEQDLRPWRKHRRSAPSLKPDGEPAYSKAELLEYLGEVLASIDSTIDSLDLATADSGFHWYKSPRLDHVILSIRHLMTHAGQLDAILRTHDLDGVDWHA